jgi:hypothetical protein
LIGVVMAAVIDIETDFPPMYAREVILVVHFIKLVAWLFVGIKSFQKGVFWVYKLREIINTNAPFSCIINHSGQQRKAMPSHLH